ncbi:MAG: arylmalonate decarboxylase [Betaproteobacteria bacterium]
MTTTTDDTSAIRPAFYGGVLVPPSNPSVEPEMQRLLHPAMTLYASRLATMPGTTLQERNRRYIDLYRDAVKTFGELELAAMVIGLTGPSYRLLPVGDAALTQELSAHAGTPVATASLAIAQALIALGARRLCLVSPYPDWLTAEAADYWRAAGCEVVRVIKMSATFRAYELTNDEVSAALAQVDHDRIDATVMSGTGMLTLPAILAARQSATKPILSSNLCSAWWLLKMAKQRSASTWFDRASPELAAHLNTP